MDASPQMLAQVLHTSLVTRLLQGLAIILCFPVAQPIPALVSDTVLCLVSDTKRGR